jgi:hypothetical protein
MKNISHNNRCPDRDSNRTPPEQKSKGVPLHRPDRCMMPCSSVDWFRRNLLPPFSRYCHKYIKINFSNPNVFSIFAPKFWQHKIKLHSHPPPLSFFLCLLWLICKEGYYQSVRAKTRSRSPSLRVIWLYEVRQKKTRLPVTLSQIQKINYDRLQTSSLLSWQTAAWDAANV